MASGELSLQYFQLLKLLQFPWKWNLLEAEERFSQKFCKIAKLPFSDDLALEAGLPDFSRYIHDTKTGIKYTK
jgi:hypothetical protein